MYDLLFENVVLTILALSDFLIFLPITDQREIFNQESQ